MYILFALECAKLVCFIGCHELADNKSLDFDLIVLSKENDHFLRKCVYKATVTRSRELNNNYGYIYIYIYIYVYSRRIQILISRIIPGSYMYSYVYIYIYMCILSANTNSDFSYNSRFICCSYVYIYIYICILISRIIPELSSVA